MGALVTPSTPSPARTKLNLDRHPNKQGSRTYPQSRRQTTSDLSIGLDIEFGTLEVDRATYEAVDVRVFKGTSALKPAKLIQRRHQAERPDHDDV